MTRLELALWNLKAKLDEKEDDSSLEGRAKIDAGRKEEETHCIWCKYRDKECPPFPPTGTKLLYTGIISTKT